MVGAAVNSGPRFAPHDPTLPAPWRALVDTSTGYIYYWNTETNVTQYEKPLPPQAPPLPAGPPPGAPVSATKQSVQAAQLPSANVSGGQDAQGGRPVEQHSVVNGNAPTSQVVSAHGGGNSNYQISNPSIPGGSNVHSNTAGNPPENMYGNSNSNPSGHSGMHIQNSSHRPSSGMSGGPVHMNSSDPYGASGRHMHGSSGGAMRGAPASSVHVPAARSSHGAPAGNMQPQPKLATLPVSQRQQGMGGVHMPVQSRQMGHTNNSGPVSTSSHGTGTTPSYKRTVGDYGNNDQDPHKRPRVQGFSEPPPTLDVHSYLRQHEITVVGDNVPPPYMTFDAANFPPEIARELHAAGFSAPTPIQAQSWPVALQSRDIVAIAKTGSGKTLGYLLPAFLHLGRTRAQPHMGPSVLVLAPTRELATQIQDEAIKFGRSSRISCTCVYGGASKPQQLRELERGADIVIATPGRLNDFLEMKRVSLRQVSYLVLDEADRMLDMGFEPQIRKIVKEIPPRRQTLMYTATWPKEVRKIAADLLVNAVQVNIGNTDQLAANKAITQHVEFVPSYEKQRRLEQILRSQEPGSKIIVFCSTKKMCDQLARSLGRAFGAAAIHGDKSQSERDHVLAQFKAGRSPVLVATDVAARGLDIKDIRVVINFDFPTGVEDYVHRIGRTGRAGATGVAFTFFSDQDSKYAKELIGVLEGANQKVPSELRDLAAKSFHPKGRGNRWEASGMGGRDSSFGGGRGDGRGDSFGGRGTWGSHGSQFDRRDRNFDRFNDRERIPDRAGGRDRYPDDKIRGRDGSRKYSSKDRGRSYSRSYSRSPARSRGRTPSRSLSRSRSRSYERYSDDHYRRSPYKGRGSFRSRSPYGSRSPRSPHRNSPSARGKAAVSSHVVSSRIDTKFSAPLKEHHISDSNNDHKSTSADNPHPSEQLIAPGTMDAAEDVNEPFDREDGLLPEQENHGGALEGERIPVA